MARREQGLPDLRVAVPTLEPDDFFVARLAQLAASAGSPAGAAASRSRPAWNVALAAASVAVIATGGAWASGVLPGTESPLRPTSPATRPVQPTPLPPPGTREPGVEPTTGAVEDPGPGIESSGADGQETSGQPGVTPPSSTDDGPQAPVPPEPGDDAQTTSLPDGDDPITSHPDAPDPSAPGTPGTDDEPDQGDQSGPGTPEETAEPDGSQEPDPQESDQPDDATDDAGRVGSDPSGADD